MPPVSIRLPARMKKGTAASGNLSIAVNISLGTVISLSGSVTAVPAMLASPMDTATETLSAKHSSIVTSIVTDIVEAPCGSRRRAGRPPDDARAAPGQVAASSSRCMGSRWCAITASALTSAPTGIAR